MKNYKKYCIRNVSKILYQKLIRNTISEIIKNYQKYCIRHVLKSDTVFHTHTEHWPLPVTFLGSYKKKVNGDLE